MTEVQVEDLKKAVKVLKDGGVILYPTDTIWGLGCDATNVEAVKRLFKIKARPDSKAMISLVDSLETLRRFVKKIPETALRELEVNDGRPLTVIYDSPTGIDELLIAPDGSAAFRISSHEFSQKLCSGLGGPLVSTSANISGEKAPATFGEIDPALREMVDYVCRSERDSKASIPSRIVKINDNDEVTVIRK